MKFSISQSELQNALTVVQKGVSTRSTLPVLSGIYIETEGDSVTFQTTDLELSIQYNAPAMVEEEGMAVVPGKLIVDIVKSLPDAAVHITAGEEDAVITCDTSSFSIKCLNPEDFPSFPVVQTDQTISIPFEVFSSMAKRVCRVASRDESRPILTGVLVTLEGGTLRMVSTDSYRLAVSQRAVETDAQDFNAVIAASFMSELAALPKTGEDISLALAENQIVVSYHETVFVNRRIEGRYPNYKQLLPPNYETRAVVGTSALAAAVKRAGLLGQNGSSVKFTVDADAQLLTLSSAVQDIGSAQESIPAQVEGQSVEIAFNGGYVVEGLSAVNDQSVALELQNSMRPGIFKGADDQDYLYLVMPVRIA